MKKIVLTVALICSAFSLLAGQVRVGGFWGEQYRNLTVNWLPHCVKMMEAGGEGEEMLNFRPTGKFRGCKWSDAYPYNVAESICLALEIDPGDDADWKAAQEGLKESLERWIPQFLSVQEPSGYIDNYTRLRNAPHFRNDGDHEFYVMGYFIEMGIAHYRMTGGTDRRLFDAAIRCADHLDSVFGPAPKRTWMNGHPGLELALQRLAQATGEKKYADLAEYFVTHQHTTKNHSDYCQAERPAAEMSEAHGHAVRANYFYTAMAQIPATRAAAERVFANIVDRKMYLTGGVGSDYKREAYGADYDLPQMAYAESCAGCGLAFFAQAIGGEKAEAVYERVIYNNILGAIAKDGTTFWYQNPLASNKPRTSWHGCPCCVGNIPRTLLALKDNLCHVENGVLVLDQYMDVAGLTIEVDGKAYTLTMKTAYPNDGKIEIATDFPGEVKARFPWRDESELYTATPAVEHGYRTVARAFELPMPLQTITADARVASCRGKTACQKGPLVMSHETQWSDDFSKKGNLKEKPAVMIPNYLRLNPSPEVHNLPNVGYSEVWIGGNESPKPLLPGFHPDPSVTKGKDGAYYLVTSSFMWLPALPIYRSTNFKDWSLVGHALVDFKAVNWKAGLNEDDGVWAPTLRYNAKDETYYLVFTFHGEHSENYLVTTKDPAGSWTAPQHIEGADGGIDPSLFFDDDPPSPNGFGATSGKVWFQANRGVPDNKKQWRSETMCYLQEIDLKTAHLFGPRIDVSSGVFNYATHAEGPHLYKMDKTYVYLHAEGGTSFDHAETGRWATKLTGPWQPLRTNPLITRRDRGNIQGLQCAGHMDLVHVSGNDYLAVFLGVRAYGPDKRVLLGRETFACPVIWRDGDLIVKDAELIEGRLVTPEPWYTVALADSKVRLHRLAHYIFDETIEVAPGESAVLYRNKDGFMSWPNETSETVRIRLVSEDGLTVSAFCNDAPLGGTRDLKPLVDAARKSRFNGLGIGVLGANKQD